MRVYKRVSKKASWTDEQLRTALNEVKQGKSKRRAAKEYGIPESTIRDNLRRGVPDIDGNIKRKLGRKPIFTKQQETEMKIFLINQSNKFYGLKLEEFRRMVFDYAEANQIPNNFNKSDKTAGRCFYESFLQRNKDISLRQPEATSLNRIEAFNKAEVMLFFSNLESVYERYNFEAHRIFNVDETGITTVQKPGRIMAPKGQKQVGAATSWERGKNNFKIIYAIDSTQSLENDKENNVLSSTAITEDVEQLMDGSTFDKENAVCLLCSEFGKNNEMWYRCVQCGAWAHAACTDAETAEDYICDFCQLFYKTKSLQ